MVAATFFATARQAFSQEPPARNLDDAFARISRQVPAFAGLWKEGDVLIIGMTDTSSRITQQVLPVIRTIFSGRSVLPNTVRFVLTQHNFTRLQEARVRARDLLSNQEATLIDVDERNNRLLIGIADLRQERAVRERLVGLGVDNTLVYIEQVLPFRSIRDVYGLQQKVRPIVGGIQIEHPTENGVAGGTLGLVVKRNELRGFITASHVTDSTGGVDFTFMSQADSSKPDELIGFEQIDPVFFTHSTNSDCPTDRMCRFSDAAFISLFENVMAKRGVITGYNWPYGYYPQQEVVAIQPITLCGDTLIKIGRTTGRTSGEVARTCADLDNHDTANLTLLCQDVFNAKSGDGDSGSPVFSFSPANKVFFHGLAALANPFQIAFSPVSAIADELGGTFDFVIGNDPPTVRILAPTNTNVTLGFGDTVTLRAEVWDPEDQHCGEPNSNCTVTWSSSLDGILGHGLEIQTNFATAGSRIIKATVNDGPNTVTDSRTLTVVANPPVVTIDFPANNATLYRDFPYMLHATAFDPSTVSDLPCTQIHWTSNNSADTGQQLSLPTNSCAVQVSFPTIGPRTLTVTAFTSQNTTAMATTDVQVANLPASGPPVLSILFPVNGTKLYPNITQSLRAVIVDPDGGQSLTYRWKIKYGTTEKVIINKMAASSVQTADPWTPGNDVPNICGGVPAILTLEATDDEGQTSSVSVQIVIPYPVC
jgi:hypothetical protein